MCPSDRLNGGLLAFNGLTLTRTFSGPGVGVRALTAGREPLAVTQTPIAAQVHQALDAQTNLTTKIAFDLHALGLDRFADAARFVVVEIVGSLVERHVGRCENLARENAADAVEVSESDLHALVAREINA